MAICTDCVRFSTCKRKGKCPEYTNKDPVEEWNEAIKGKPIAEWPPMPKELDLIVYDNGIILTTAETIEEYMKIKMGVSNA